MFISVAETSRKGSGDYESPLPGGGIAALVLAGSHPDAAGTAGAGVELAHVEAEAGGKLLLGLGHHLVGGKVVEEVDADGVEVRILGGKLRELVDELVGKRAGLALGLIAHDGSLGLAR